jgi:hypothetical protein
MAWRSRVGVTATLATLLALPPSAEAGVYTYMSAYGNCQASKSRVEVDWGGTVYSDEYEGTVQVDLYGLTPSPELLDSDIRPFQPEGTTPRYFRMNVRKSQKFDRRFPRYRSVITFRRGQNWTSGTHEC